MAILASPDTACALQPKQLRGPRHDLGFIVQHHRALAASRAHCRPQSGILQKSSQAAAKRRDLSRRHQQSCHIRHNLFTRPADIAGASTGSPTSMASITDMGRPSK